MVILSTRDVRGGGCLRCRDEKVFLLVIKLKIRIVRDLKISYQSGGVDTLNNSLYNKVRRTKTQIFSV